MGYHKHSTIIVTSWDTGGNDPRPDYVQLAHDKIREIIEGVDERFLVCLTPVQDSITNGYKSFAFLPDGSKEGWRDSDTGDTIRNMICDYLDSAWGNPGWVEYVEIHFGGDDRDIRYRAMKEYVEE